MDFYPFKNIMQRLRSKVVVDSVAFQGEAFSYSQELKELWISRCFQFKRHQYRAVFHLHLFIYNALYVILFDTLHIRNTSFRAFSILARHSFCQRSQHLGKTGEGDRHIQYDPSTRFPRRVVCSFVKKKKHKLRYLLTAFSFVIILAVVNLNNILFCFV